MSATLVSSKHFTGVLGKSAVVLVNHQFSLPRMLLSFQVEGKPVEACVQPPGCEAGLDSVPEEIVLPRASTLVILRDTGFTVCWLSPAYKWVVSSLGCILLHIIFLFWNNIRFRFTEKL